MYDVFRTRCAWWLADFGQVPKSKPALGPALRKEMLGMLKTLRAERAERPMSVVMVTHHPDDAADHADRVAFLDQGVVLAVGPTRAILSGQSDPRVARYLGTQVSDS